ncbi:MAG: glucosamine-6-phosphate deaminase [Oscillospiraceae bacterium]|jgi:glucosamine-6-phosphate deaminase|nr:glucosamine-6-phosphate deaminase [Oscillospiraceae bacterium]
MKLIHCKDYQEMSKKAAEIFAAQVILKPDCVLGLATGSTPVGTYEHLIEWYKAGILDFSQVKTVNLDEYVGLDETSDQSYRYFMNHNLFDHINIDKANTNVPNGKAPDIAAETDRYEALIKSLGGIDVQLLGIGNNGHIAFNEPHDAFDGRTHEVQLTESTIQANARFFASMDDVPKRAVSMGIGTIMQARKIVLIANGPKKADIIYETCFGPITPNVPASALQLHPDVTIIVDEDAYAAVAAKCGK